MNRTDLVDAYFDWLTEKIEIFDANERSLNDIYSWSLRALFNTEFKFFEKERSKTGSYDIDRAYDGLYMRELFSDSFEVAEDFWRGLIFDGCSVLEMMIALAIRMEDNYLFDPELGDRTAQWFWNMFESLGLMDYDNDNYDAEIVQEILAIFVNKQYRRNGQGGLFTFEKADFNARNMDIWTQMTHWIGCNFA